MRSNRLLLRHEYSVSVVSPAGSNCINDICIGEGATVPQSANLGISEDSPLDQDILRHFQPLCAAIPANEITLLQSQLHTYVQEATAGLLQNEFLDLATVRHITATLAMLLVDYHRHSESQRALIVGAIRYFIKQDDAEHDVQSLLGLDDDVKVLNFVLDQLGLPDKKITL